MSNRTDTLKSTLVLVCLIFFVIGMVWMLTPTTDTEMAYTRAINAWATSSLRLNNATRVLSTERIANLGQNQSGRTYRIVYDTTDRRGQMSAIAYCYPSTDSGGPVLCSLMSRSSAAPE